MTPVEIIALIVILLGLIKLIFLITKPRAWFDGTSRLVRSSTGFPLVALVLMLVALKYLLTELTIVEIFAVFGFVIPFFWLALTPYREELVQMAQRRFEEGNIWKKNWLITLIWLVLMVWVLVEIF